MTKHVHKSLSKIEISFVWHSRTAAFRDIFVCQGSARLSFAVSRKAVPRTAPLFWCQEGISYVALDLPGFEAPVTKFVLNFDFDTAHLLQGPDAWEVRSPSVTCGFNIGFSWVSLKIPISSNASHKMSQVKLLSFEVHTLHISPTPRLKHAFGLALGCFSMLRFASTK